jgi:uncharacterized protein YciI
MGYAILARDGADPSLRMNARDRHLAVLQQWCGDGRMAFGAPIFDKDWKVAGSLMILTVPDETHVKEYISEEPFAREGVWTGFDVFPYAIASLPYRPLPQPGAPVSSTRTHTVSIGWDADDAEAPARRAKARPPHLERVTQAARDGILTIGGAILDAKGKMRGSIAVTAHASDAEAEAWWAEDPYIRDGVWSRVDRWGTRLVGLPYKPLPGAE